MLKKVKRIIRKIKYVIHKKSTVDRISATDWWLDSNRPYIHPFDTKLDNE